MEPLEECSKCSTKCLFKLRGRCPAWHFSLPYVDKATLHHQMEHTHLMGYTHQMEVFMNTQLSLNVHKNIYIYLAYNRKFYFILSRILWKLRKYLKKKNHCKILFYIFLPFDMLTYNIQILNNLLFLLFNRIQKVV